MIAAGAAARSSLWQVNNKNILFLMGTILKIVTKFSQVNEYTIE